MRGHSCARGAKAVARARGGVARRYDGAPRRAGRGHVAGVPIGAAGGSNLSLARVHRVTFVMPYQVLRAYTVCLK